MKYLRIGAAFFLIGISGCVELTPAGARVQLITEDQAPLIAQCKYLKNVSVSSRDALRNMAASLSGDTALMSNRDVGTTQYIRGDVYDCSNSVEPVLQQAQAQKKLEPTPQQKADSEYLRKSGLCQLKGGVWISNQCVIAIE